MSLLLPVAGCRHTLDTSHPVPPPAATIRDALLSLPQDPESAEDRAVSDVLRPLIGRSRSAEVIADWRALAAEHPDLQPGTPVVIESQGVVSANLNVRPVGEEEPVGRVRVVVGPDGRVRQVDVLPPLRG